MVQITIELVRKRSEHNEGEISTLEELSLHQEDLEKIEHLQNWCRELRILYLQSNLLSKIENLHKMKKLEYLNLALNNIERVENLEGCESLQKLDLTLNFIGDLTSIESLCQNIHLESLFLTGNPCADFEGYRDYVIATLPQLKYLDSEYIERSHRILALQKYKHVTAIILEEQKKCKVKREAQRQRKLETETNNVNMDDPEEIKRYWDQTSDNSPETRIEMAQQSRRQREEKEKQRSGGDRDPPKRTVKLFAEDGRPRCINEPHVPFQLTEDDENNRIVLNLEVYKFLDTSLVDADVQPCYVRVVIKGKVFQIALPEEVHPDKSSAQRSQITGHLVISMPMVKEAKVKKTSLPKLQRPQEKAISAPLPVRSKRELLEIGRAENSTDFSRITEMKPERNHNPELLFRWKVNSAQPQEKVPSEYFTENPEVPPLE